MSIAVFLQNFLLFMEFRLLSNTERIYIQTPFCIISVTSLSYGMDGIAPFLLTVTAAAAAALRRECSGVCPDA